MKALVIICLSAVLVASQCNLREDQKQAEFVSFIRQYDKAYASEEMFKRLNIFKSNLDMICQHNIANFSFTLGLNEFADMSNDEFTATHLGHRAQEYPQQDVDTTIINPSNDVDWRSKGIVNPVKNQGSCGSCWAFSATGAVEGFHAQKTGKLISLAEQQLVDCCRGSACGGSGGCNGGDEVSAVQWVGKNGGQCAGAEYPYTARDGTCKTTCTKVGHVSGAKRILGEPALISAIDTTVVTVAVAAGGVPWQLYKGGVMDFFCPGILIDHAILAVGYGPNYFIVKNSWGVSWGESGFVRMVRGKNLCGIATAPSYPV